MPRSARGRSHPAVNAAHGVAGGCPEQWDLSARKKFALLGTTKLELRADVFNVFDRLNFNNPNVTVTAAEFGRIATARIPRQTQLSFRLEF